MRIGITNKLPISGMLAKQEARIVICILSTKVISISFVKMLELTWNHEIKIINAAK